MTTRDGGELPGAHVPHGIPCNPERGAILGSDSHAPARARYKYTQVKRLYRYGHFLGNTMKGSKVEKVGMWVDLATRAAKLAIVLVQLFHMLT